MTSLCYLIHIEDLESAVLEFLYNGMCNARQFGHNDMSGWAVLVQVWAWERIPRIQPIRNVVPPNPIMDPEAPLAHRAIHKGNKGTWKSGKGWKAFHDDVNPHWDNRISNMADTLNDIYHIVDKYCTKYPTRDHALNAMIEEVLNSSLTALTIGPDALNTVSSQRLVESQPTLSQQPQPSPKKAPKKNIGGGRKKHMPRPLQTDYGQSSADRRIVPFCDPTIVDEKGHVVSFCAILC
ncbi:OLC1v1029258C1 [Oldenlandia corymbosa var. corymbosa]|uniref:OLC1v1029258C1 n=1 Tax=Oldenlandia corymbosa var. corymbosa TaxID=529605 RepID=A0AAV1CGI9_OLDCO|nr:OLC1v1029258C1 [Oldenlandia corymbosa var. corymbosa]